MIDVLNFVVAIIIAKVIIKNSEKISEWLFNIIFNVLLTKGSKLFSKSKYIHWNGVMVGIWKEDCVVYKKLFKLYKIKL